MDLTGLEPVNLSDANRALSQLSYRPGTSELYDWLEGEPPVSAVGQVPRLSSRYTNAALLQLLFGEQAAIEALADLGWGGLTIQADDRDDTKQLAEHVLWTTSIRLKASPTISRRPCQATEPPSGAA